MMNRKFTHLGPVVDGDVSASVNRVTRCLQPNTGGIGCAPGRHQDVAAFDSLIGRGRMQSEADSLPGPTLHIENLGAETYQDTSVAQHVQAASVIAALPAPARWRRISKWRMMHGKEHRSRVVLRLNALELSLKITQLKIRHRRPLSS